jgi:hypothetical protein
MINLIPLTFTVTVKLILDFVLYSGTSRDWKILILKYLYIYP